MSKTRFPLSIPAGVLSRNLFAFSPFPYFVSKVFHQTLYTLSYLCFLFSYSLLASLTHFSFPFFSSFFFLNTLTTTLSKFFVHLLAILPLFMSYLFPFAFPQQLLQTFFTFLKVMKRAEQLTGVVNVGEERTPALVIPPPLLSLFKATCPV